MNITTWLSFAGLLGVLVSVLSLLVTVRNYDRQIAISVALECSARMRALMDAVPQEVWEAEVFGGSPILSDNPQIKMGILRMLYQFRELFELHEHGLMPRRIWHMWQGDLEAALQGELLKREWPKIRPHFLPHKSFCSYIDRLQQAD